jgi:hypothetical protein
VIRGSPWRRLTWRVVDPDWDGYLDLMAEMWRRSGLIEDAQTTGEETAAAVAEVS